MAPSMLQIALIVLVVFLIFGAGKLPNVMGDLAKGVKNFKKGLEDDDTKTEDQKKITDQTVSAKTSDVAEKEKTKS